MSKLDLSFILILSSPHYLCLQLLHNRSMQLFMNYIIFIKLTSFEIKINFHFISRLKLFLSPKWPLPKKEYIKMFEQVTFIFMYNNRNSVVLGVFLS